MFVKQAILEEPGETQEAAALMPGPPCAVDTAKVPRPSDVGVGSIWSRRQR